MTTTAVTGSSSTTDVKFVDKDKIGLAGLQSDTFLKLLIAQLQNQDPTEPVGNEEILNQLSQMRSLQSNTELSDTLKGLASSQQITTGASFLGKSITGKNQAGAEITGIADRVFIEDNTTVIGIGDDKVKISDITAVNLPETTPAPDA
jgi:flagellar basal-body rod modification protein FlgD